MKSTYRYHYGDNTVKYSINFLLVADFETTVTHSNDFVQVIFNAFGRLFFGYFGTKAFEILPQFLCLYKII